MGAKWNYTLLALLAFVFVKAQVNLVPNGSFEDTLECIYTDSQLGHLNHWSTPTNATPDAFAVDFCNVYLNSNIIAVPTNYWGHQLPRTGKNYAGLYFLLDNDYPDREYIQVHLSEKLKPGVVYCVSYYISMSDAQSCLAIRGFEAYFSPDSIYIEDTPPVFPILTFPAQISVDTLVSDSISWVEISGYFMAQGDEEYMLIGNFKPQNQVQRIIINDDLPNKGAYYYIDDVSVIECDSLVGIEENIIDYRLEVYPNPAYDFVSIELPKSYNQAQLNIYNLTGQLIAQKQLLQSTNSVGIPSGQIPISDLGNGMYIFVVQSGGEVVGRHRIVVAR
ncbi:MAG: T9SS type A sorting domain-containing protein [Sphingobacteriales bacterium JAD_PAG50586_3]|nr:MAG: T9SS type A sorting domain-containing protein [Sphingobacteriales bacterium JAD_PAG50586_3]